MLHPIVALSTLLWGVVNGSKVAIIASFWFGGVAQWWIARSLGLGGLARVWSGALAVVASYLSGRMENAAFGLVLSSAMCALVIATALNLARNPNRVSTALMAVALASALVAGQAYIQFGLLMTGPAYLFLLLNTRLNWRPVWRNFAAAAGVSVLLAAPLLVPLAHFFPHLHKDADRTFPTAQPLEYLVLNLVVRDLEFLKTPVLGKGPFPNLYANYVGWVTVALALLCLALWRPQDRRYLLFLASGVGCALLAASAVPQRWLVDYVPAVAGFRFTPLLAGVAIPYLLGLAAYGLDRVLALDWPELRFEGAGLPPGLRIDLRWILLFPLLLGLRDAYQFGRTWVHLVPIHPSVYEVLDTLRTPTLQWVNPPFGEGFWVEPAIRTGLKLSVGLSGWRWGEGREFPTPRREAIRGAPPEGARLVRGFEGLSVYEYPQREYARIETEDGMVPCQASGTGGHLRVECANQKEGTLVVEENSWSGWHVWRDGAPVELLPGARLSAQAPPGQHVYEFRYEPWDVPVGLALGVVGALLTLGMLLPEQVLLAVRTWLRLRSEAWRGVPPRDIDAAPGAP